MMMKMMLLAIAFSGCELFGFSEGDGKETV
jgi:hypothetical protein